MDRTPTTEAKSIPIIQNAMVLLPFVNSFTVHRLCRKPHGIAHIGEDSSLYQLKHPSRICMQDSFQCPIVYFSRLDHKMNPGCIACSGLNYMVKHWCNG